MSEEGVNGLSLSEVARRLGVQPPSIYKYFPSLMAIYDELFLRGQTMHLGVVRDAMATAEPGIDALITGLQASGRGLLANRAVAELLFWRPVPKFEPSPRPRAMAMAMAMAISQEMIDIQRAALGDAVTAGQLGPGADSDEAVFLISTLIIGVLSQAFATSPTSNGARGASPHCSPSSCGCSWPSTHLRPEGPGARASDRTHHL